MNHQFEERLKESISEYVGADRHAIDQRLLELDSEWNIERLIETRAPLMIAFGIGLGLAYDKKWFALPLLAASMVVLHNLQDWCPPLAALRRLGFRTAKEINEERFALKSLRGDFREAAVSSNPEMIFQATRS